MSSSYKGSIRYAAPYIQRHDRVKAIDGPFEGKKGYVTRVDDAMACVVFKDVWSFGV